MSDILFSTIEQWQGEFPWGSMLDAGTGEQSLEWITSLENTSWTAVTGDQYRAEGLKHQFNSRIRTQDSIITANWLNHETLANKSFDVVIADYLLGAIEGFSPYFQDQLFSRLKPHVGQFLYIIGMEPLAKPSTEGEKLIKEIVDLRDACILLAGHKPYREYPRTWTERQMKRDGYTILKSCSFPILFGRHFINGQLDVCKRKLGFIKNTTLSRSLAAHILELRTASLRFVDRNGKIEFGSDYIIKAE
jgi:hypothetical protein